MKTYKGRLVCLSYPRNPVYTRRLDLSVLTLSLSLYRHPSICILNLALTLLLIIYFITPTPSVFLPPSLYKTVFEFLDYLSLLFYPLVINTQFSLSYSFTHTHSTLPTTPTITFTQVLWFLPCDHYYYGPLGLDLLYIFTHTTQCRWGVLDPSVLSFSLSVYQHPSIYSL